MQPDYPTPPSNRPRPFRLDVAPAGGESKAAADKFQVEVARMLETLPEPDDVRPHCPLPDGLLSGTPGDEALDQPLGVRLLDQLEKSDIPSFMALRVKIERGIVTLRGEVTTPYEKKLVVQVCERVAGVVAVVDEISVRPTDRIPWWNLVQRLSPKDERYEYAMPVQGWLIGVSVLVLGFVWALATDGQDGRLRVYPVEGQVLLDGSFPEGAVVVLHPGDPAATVRPRGFVQADGSYKITTYLPSDGAPAGEYKLTVEWHKPVRGPGGDFEPGPNLLAERLSQPDSSPFEVTVQSGRNQLRPIHIPR